MVGVFGFRGEVKLHLDNPETDLFDEPFPVLLEGPDGVRRPATLSARSGAGKRILGHIVGVTDEAAARALSGFRIFVNEDDLPAPDEGEVYVYQLEGAEVVEDGAVVGRVVTITPSGPVSILEIDAGRREPVFLPLTDPYVLEVAPGRVVIAPGALAD